MDKPLLRFLTCGSVDDGKSTLIGRLLYDSKLIFDDQIGQLARRGKGEAVAEDDLDFAMLLDGLEAEREQGITIDVAYRFFATPRRRFIVADTPGHEQYTRNMATGASTSDLAILLVDARHGVLTQTRRHANIVSLLGIRHIVLAVNKIDLVDYDQARFDEIVNGFAQLAADKGFLSLEAIPLSARLGDNVTRTSKKTEWYRGLSLLDYLEEIDVGGKQQERPFRFPVQYVNRPDQDFRGFCGTIAGGTVAEGDEIRVMQSGQTATVVGILRAGGEKGRAVEGEAVTLVLDREVDISRGSMLASPTAPSDFADQFRANVVWFDDNDLLPGRSYILQTECEQVNVTVTDLRYRIDADNAGHEVARSLAMNEIGVCNFSAQHNIAFDSYEKNRSTGAFILIDRMTNATAGAGMFVYPLRRSSNIQWQALDVDRRVRAAIKHQRPCVLWFTGLSGSGKSTIANLLDKKLSAAGRHTYVLDGDNIRHGLNRDLGFTEHDRIENIRRVSEVARLMADAGLIVLVSFISPFRAEREMARQMMEEGDFVEIFVEAPLDECIRRDPKGLYAKVQAGEISNFTGFDSPYEVPEAPDIVLHTTETSAEALAETLEKWLRDHRMVS